MMFSPHSLPEVIAELAASGACHCVKCAARDVADNDADGALWIGTTLLRLCERRKCREENSNRKNFHCCA